MKECLIFDVVFQTASFEALYTTFRCTEKRHNIPYFRKYLSALTFCKTGTVDGTVDVSLQV